MAQPKNYERDSNGIRLDNGGMNTVLPTEVIPPGKYPYLQNVRKFVDGKMTSRPPQTTAIETASFPVNSIRRLNDSTPDGPPSGSVLIYGDTFGNLYAGATKILSLALSGNMLNMVPFRPNASVQPWMYVSDRVALYKVRSDGLVRKTGIKEPQTAPSVSTQSITASGTVSIPGTTRPWSNVSGQNAAYNYGDTGDGTNPVIILTSVAGSKITINVVGSVIIGGVGYVASDAGPTGPSNPGHYVISSFSTILVAAFTDSSGNIIAGSPSAPSVISVGSSITLTVPSGATQLQLGVDGTGGSFSANSGSFTASYTITTSAVTPTVGLIGNVTAYYWGDSPHSGPTAQYIWKNAADTGGSGTVRDISTAAGSTTGNSLIFDSAGSDGTQPVEWTTLNTDGTPSGQKVVFSPALESEGYQDFNMCIVGNIFIPAGGTYNISISYKDNVLWGIGNNASWSGSGSTTGGFGQTMTVVNKLPLLPAPVISGSGGVVGHQSVAVTFPAAGIYPIEIDWDYWYHSGRTLVVQCNGATIAPMTTSVKINVQYRYRFRASESGARSNPSPASVQQQIPAIANTVTPEWSSDPQVDKVDFFRIDSNLDNWTFCATGPNTNPPTPITDTSLDADIANNEILEFDNYEPFPSIDLPRKGTCNVIGGVIHWASGDQFNLRWLPGTQVLIGSPQQNAYKLYNRPTSTTTMIATGVPDGINLVFEIPEPILAAQPLASTWGPSDNIPYQFGCYDPLRPGTLYYGKAYNPDSAPQTNQIEVTHPSEILMNGVMCDGVSVLMSTENAWTIYPTYTNAYATVQGVSGQAFTLIKAPVERGLYIRPAIATNGKVIVFRAKDSIRIMSAQGGDQSITDDIRNLFPQAGENPSSAPSPVTIGGYTVNPPNDGVAESQSLSIVQDYIYYDYQDVNGVRVTLVYDIHAKGWMVDVYQWPVIRHYLDEGKIVNGTLLGCQDNTIRNLSNTNGAEVGQCAVLTRCENFGDARSLHQIGDVFYRAQIQNGSTVNIALYGDRYQSALTGYVPNVLNGNGKIQPYIVDWSTSIGPEVLDIASIFTWPLGDNTFIELWQPNWIDKPESVNDRVTDWDDCGYLGAKFVQGLVLEADTNGVGKILYVQDSDTMTLTLVDQDPVVFSGQSVQTFTFNTPIIAHSLRIVSSDGVSWRMWGVQWIYEKYAEKVDDIVSDFESPNGGKAMFVQGFLLEADTQNQAKNISVQNGDDLTMHVPDQSPATFNGRSYKVFTFSTPFIAHSLRLLGLEPQTGIVTWRKFNLQWIFEPYAESADDIVSDFQSPGGGAAMFIQGFILEADTGNVVKSFDVQSGDDLSIHMPDSDPVAFNGRTTKAFSFNPPFVAHSVRLLGQGTVAWRKFNLQWVFQPYPEAVTNYQTEPSSHGFKGFLHIREFNLAYISTAPVSLILTFDQWPSITLTFPSSNGSMAKVKMPCYTNKFKTVAYQVISTQPVRIFKGMCEVKVGVWGRSGSYENINPFGGPSTDAAPI